MSDPIKEAFSKVKEDISNLQSQISSLTREIQELKRTLDQTHNQTDRQNIQTHNQTHQTDRQPRQEIGGLRSPNSSSSIGNEGVQTDRQTNRQTDTTPKKFALTQSSDSITQIEKVAEIVNSLDDLKRNLRRQFKQLTQQEMLVFSTIYQLSDQGLDVDYSILSKKTNLSESSIRDYVQKIIKKGIPIAKTKENNKIITLSVSPEFKRMASLDTLISLREL